MIWHSRCNNQFGVDSRQDLTHLSMHVAESVEQPQVIQAKVLHEYKPQEKDELLLRPGDIISDVVELPQGWCKVSILTAFL